MPTAGARVLLAPAAVAVALLAASGWLAEPRVGYLAVCLVATAAGAEALRRYGLVAGRMPLALSIAALGIVCIIGGRAQVRLGRFSRAPAEVGSLEAAAQRNRLKRRVDDELVALRDVAHRAQRVPTEPRAASATLASC